MPQINPDVFAQCMGLLSDRFSKALKAPTSRLYLELLSEELDSEELMLGTRQVIRSAKFFPSPQELIDAARPGVDAALDALAALRQIQEGEFPHEDPVAREAITLAGAWGAWSKLEGFRRDRREQLFLETYARVYAQRASMGLLEAAAVTPRLAAGETR